MAEEKANELFRLYKESGDIRVRNEIAEKYLYIADILAKKFVGRGVEYDDLKQIASYALLRGIDRFDPDLGMQFTTFITPTITGEIKNYFRDKARVIKLPRRLSEISAAVKKYSAEYEAEKGVKPKVKQIAEALSLTEEDVVKSLETGGVLSLDKVGASEDGESDGSLYTLLSDGEDKYENFELKETLLAEMRDFSDTEKALVKYRYVDELSQSETAKRLGVSQMFVSRMERKILLKLKERLQGLV
ncbi:MAG: sigma-70 family RNA polymerase sigma factor [Clostridia bacterium]|nr:sigma-70 family RNA polymerase sigma factor [Clostridia bacterium]